MSRYYHIAFFILAALFVLLKIPYLELPFFWDEAWVYGHAVKEMYLNGPSLSPDAINVELGRGHPLLFHFLASSWMIIFGDSLLSLHCFALTITMMLLLFVYITLSKNYNNNTAIFAVILIAVQPVFFTQSVFVLPEIMLAFFLYAAIYYHVKKNYVLYFLFAAFAILVKETAIVLFVSLSLAGIIFPIRDSKIPELIKKLILINLPVIVFLLFLLWQKIIFGWYFYPAHIDIISFTFTKLENYFSYLFIYQGRNILSFIFILVLTWNFISKTKWDRDEKLFFLSSGIFIVLLLLFSSANFYSNRYIVSAIILYCIIVSVLLFVHKENKIITLVLMLIPIASGLINTINSKSINDHNRGYADAVKCIDESVDYTSKNYPGKKIYSTFLITNALTNPAAGYLNNPVLNASNNDTAGAEIIILDNFEDNPFFDFENTQLKLLHECEKGNAKVRIFGQW